MPESYIEPMTDRQTCFKCNKTVTGKKKLSKCSRCHAITYCGKECQVADWPRHSWNCVPVMVTEIPGKGRGLVAARDIKKGEKIFTDYALIKLPPVPKGLPDIQHYLKSLKKQFKNMHDEAKSQFLKLNSEEFHTHTYRTVASITSQRDYKIFKLYMRNSTESTEGSTTFFLNYALINHSCAPNAYDIIKKSRNPEEDDDKRVELRAIKNISKGEEINNFYFSDVKKFGSTQRKWKAEIKKDLGFDCKCPVCLGQLPCQEKTLKKLIELHNKLDPTPSDWERDAGIRDRIVDLTLQLYMGKHTEKIVALQNLAFSGHNAGNLGLVRKAQDKLKQMSEDTKLDWIQGLLNDMERQFASNTLD